MKLKTLHAWRDAVVSQRATLMAEWRELRALFDATGPGPEFNKLVARRKGLRQRMIEWGRRARELDALAREHNLLARPR